MYFSSAKFEFRAEQTDRAFVRLMICHVAVEAECVHPG